MEIDRRAALGSGIAGEAVDSALTFGPVGSASAPGQLEVSELQSMLDALSGKGSKDHRP
jgi:3-dehydroquinate dehydratase